MEVIDAPFYRGPTACIVGRMIGDGSITPFVIVFLHTAEGLRIESVLLARSDISSLFGYHALVFPRRPAGGQRGRLAAAHLHAGQTRR